MESLRKKNLASYGVEYEYDTQTTCDWNGDCNGDSICRCSTIENPRVTKVDISQLVSFFGTKLSKIDKYAVDRILRFNKAYDPFNYEFEISPGYYGEEMDGVHLNNQVASAINKMVAEILFLKSDDAKVESVLRMEYGHLLPVLEGRSWTVEVIEKDEIRYGNDEYRKKLSPTACEMYKDYDGIRGVVIPKDDGYRLIDGYHRCSQASGTISILVGRLPCEKKTVDIKTNKPVISTSPIPQMTSSSGSSKKRTGTTKGHSTTRRSTGR